MVVHSVEYDTALSLYQKYCFLHFSILIAAYLQKLRQFTSLFDILVTMTLKGNFLVLGICRKHIARPEQQISNILEECLFFMRF